MLDDDGKISQAASSHEPTENRYSEDKDASNDETWSRKMR
jgi:hypothetical protein